MYMQQAQHYRSVSDAALPSELTAADWNQLHHLIEQESRKGSYTLEGFDRDSEFYKFVKTLNSRQVDTLKQELKRLGFNIQYLYGLAIRPVAMSWYVSWEVDEND